MKQVRIAFEEQFSYDIYHMKTATRPKEITHKRIVETAARAIRRSGYDGTSVANIMKEAGLTHGGFYAHFSSRDAMLAEAADQAGAEAVAMLVTAAEAVPPEEALLEQVRVYLSEEHVNNVESGCPVAALGSEMPRQAPEVRRAATRRIKEMVEVVTRQLPSREQDVRAQAWLAMSTMVGALIMARAVDEPALSDEILEAALSHFSPLRP